MVEQTLKVRQSPFFGNENISGPLDYEYPLESELSFENPIVGLMHRPGRAWGINIVMANGNKSTLPYEIVAENQFKQVKILPRGSKVAKVKMWGLKNDHQFLKVQFIDDENDQVLEAGANDMVDADQKLATEFDLQPNERLLGIRCKRNPDPKLAPRSHDLVFVIGKISEPDKPEEVKAVPEKEEAPV